MLAFKHDEVRQEYERWRKIIAAETGAGGIGMSLDDVLAVHFLIVDLFYKQREGLGGIGPKDVGLLSSAVSRQHASYGGKDKWATIEDKIATLLYGVVMNHPFHDANKRTGFLSTLYFLQKAGRFPRISAKQFEDFVVTIADKSFRNTEKFKRSFEGSDDAEIHYIAHFIHTRTRDIDKRDYTITFMDLDRILRRFDFALANPQGNYIDVVYLDGPGKGEKVCQIGFPSWKKEVTRGAMKTVRRATELTVLNGIDSQVFFKEVEPLGQLLALYHDPLLRLADR